MHHTSNYTIGQISICLAVALVASVITAIEPAYAANFLKADKVHLTSLHRIDGDVYALGETVTVDGSIDGDLLAAGGQVTCSGEITGSQTIAAGEFSCSGRVDGSVRFIGGDAEIEGYVGRSVLFLGQNLKVREMAVIREDVNAYGRKVQIAGVVMGNVSVGAAVIEISGQIDGDVELDATESIEISPPAVISGNLTYSGPKELDLESSGVTVLGEVERREPEKDDAAKQEADELTDTVLRFSRLFAAFLFGLILIRLCPRYLQEAFAQLRCRFAACAAAGLLAAAAVVMSMLVLLLAVVLSIVGLILSSGDQAAGGALLLVFSTLMIPVTSFAFVSGGVLFYAGKLLPSLLVGYGLIRIFKRQPKLLGKWQLLIGLTILTGFYAIPRAGWLFYLTVGIIGMGAIILGVRHCRPIDSQSTTAPEPPPSETSAPEPSLPGS